MSFRAFFVILFTSSTLLLSSAFADSCGSALDLVQKSSIQNYQPFLQICETASSQEVILTRKMRSGSHDLAFIVDPSSLKTQLIEQQCLQSCRNTSVEELSSQTRYGQMLEESSKAPFLTENDGLNQSTINKGVLLTVDMCPSRKNMDTDFFSAIESKAQSQKVSFAVAITDRWISQFPDSFQKLKNMQKNKNIELSWINHSATHPYKKGLKFSENFLFSKNKLIFLLHLNLF